MSARPARRVRRSAGQRAYVDTNLVVALFAGARHPLHEPALAIFRRVAEGSLDLILTSPVIQELVYLAEPLLGWNRRTFSERIVRFIEADGILLAEPTLAGALQIYADDPRLDFTDAYLAAAALEVGPPLVASLDRDLDRVKEIRRIGA